MAAQSADAGNYAPAQPDMTDKSAMTTLLPTELLHIIAEYLPTSSQIALKLTSRTLFLRLPAPLALDKTTASHCELTATRRYLSERAEVAGGRRRCVLCGGLMPLAFFRDSIEPVCRWHDGWFAKVADVDGLEHRGELELEGREGKMKRLLCVHCKEIRAWDVEACPCEANGGCASCGVVEVECRVRSAGTTIILGSSR